VIAVLLPNLLPTKRALVAALQGVRRIVAAGSAGYDARQLTEPAEVALRDAFETLRAVAGVTGSPGGFIDATQALVDPIDTFIDEVLVVTDDPGVRAARLGLPAGIRDMSAEALDWQALGTALGRVGADGSGR
jgi:glycyl-tRNA synthetase